MSDEIPAEHLTGRTVLGFYAYTHWPAAMKRRCVDVIARELPEGRAVHSVEYVKSLEPQKTIRVVLTGNPVLTYDVPVRQGLEFDQRTAEILRAFFAAEFA